MDMVQECQNLEDHAKNMIVPDNLEEAHSYLVMTMKLRHQGMELYKPPIFEAVSSNSQKIDESEITKALKYLALSDLAHQSFMDEVNKLIKDENIGEKPLKSVFLEDDTIYEKKNVLEFLNRLKGENFKGAGDLSVLDVATNPLRISINTKTDVRVLPITDEIDVRVEVKNNTDKPQKDVPVEVEFLSEGEKKGIKKQGKIVEIAANGTAKITIKGFQPVKDKLNIFKIKVGPLFGEQNTADNYYEYKFILSDDVSGNNANT